jgi:hypothetical protein
MIPAPMLMCIALVCVKPNTHGETTSQKPSSRLSHSSQLENITIEIIEVAAMRALVAQISIRAFLLAKANSKSDVEGQVPATTFGQWAPADDLVRWRLSHAEHRRNEHTRQVAAPNSMPHEKRSSGFTRSL